MAGEPDAQWTGDRPDLGIDGVDQPHQRADPQPIRGIQRRRREQET
jgi:hypothetical protein